MEDGELSSRLRASGFQDVKVLEICTTCAFR